MDDVREGCSLGFPLASPLPEVSRLPPPLWVACRGSEARESFGGVGVYQEKKLRLPIDFPTAGSLTTSDNFEKFVEIVWPRSGDTMGQKTGARCSGNGLGQDGPATFPLRDRLPF